MPTDDLAPRRSSVFFFFLLGGPLNVIFSKRREAMSLRAAIALNKKSPEIREPQK